MGYRLVDTTTVEEEEHPDRECDCVRLSEPAGLEKMAMNRFRAKPGEQIPLAFHYHDEQEEAFYVLDGTLHVETPDEVYEVPADSLFVIDPGSPQRAYNPEDGDGPVTALAIGAPAVDGGVHAYEPDDERE